MNTTHLVITLLNSEWDNLSLLLIKVIIDRYCNPPPAHPLSIQKHCMNIQ